MKASRDQLKALIKDIMIEILSEGLGTLQPGHGAVRVPAPGRPPITGVQEHLANGRRKPQYDSRLDTPVGARQPTDALKEAVRREAAASGIPFMADILADTAMTTLPTQLGAGDSMGQPSPGGSSTRGPVQEEKFHGEVADVFGDSAQMRSDGSSHWADLAFMTPGKK